MTDPNQGLMTIERPAIEPSVAVAIMEKGYAIERNPTPVRMLFIPGSLVGTDLLDVQRPETDTAVAAEDEDAVVALIAGNKVAKLNADLAQAKAGLVPESSPGTPEKNGLGKSLLQAVRRTRLGVYAATAATTAVAFFAAHTEFAKADAASVGPAVVFGNNLRYFEDSTSPVPIGPAPGEPSEPAAGDTPSSPGSEVAPTDPETVKQNCRDAALQRPKIVKALVLHAGKFGPGTGTEHESEQRFLLTTQYTQQMPEYCDGVYGQGNKAKAQAKHNGRWVNVTPWHGVDILKDSDRGTWYDLGNELGIDFAICRARILIQATMTDLSVDTGKQWPPHPIVAKRAFPPVRAELLPRKPKAC